MFFKLHYNNSIHLVTGFTLAQLFFGRELTPIDATHPVSTIQSPITYIQKIKQHILETRKMVQNNEKEYFEKKKKFINGRKKQYLKIGNIVYVKAFTV